MSFWWQHGNRVLTGITRFAGRNFSDHGLRETVCEGSGIMISIETERLIVRPIRVDDAKRFMRLVGSSTLSVEFHREKIAALEELAGKGEAVLIVIVRKSDGVMMGHSVVSRSKDGEIAHVDYWMGTEFRGLGLMSEAAQPVIEVAEHVLHISTFEAVINSENQASAAVAKRMGMELMESVERTIDGRSWTDWRFGLGGH